ncbi:ATP-dependent RNA helicase DDX24 [Rhinichthys klamathensis goyatoka]|uniref:ATP-dependent RNA helicase DDX24 n=1 Tax=Rhinichthys klamathensis goyatoka TaxID=3034132 RepID=UPI0024B52F4D|nr:ATP-dependent RNA helicase DDX24 [Rhinichthys klamathensis goyatoka]
MKMKKKMKAKVKKGSGRLLSSRRGIVVRGRWKPVDVDPSLFSDQGLDGLVCFEELTDYSLVEPERAVAARETTPKDKKKKKRKAGEVDAEEQPQSDAEDNPDEEKIKRQKKNKPDEESQEEAVEDQISQDECADVTPETQHKTAKQKKKKKKKQKQKPATADAPAECQKKSRNWSAAPGDPEAPGTDVSAWKDLFVPAPVLKALSALGFAAPTPIQALALPPAIRDRLDVLGAAETGSGKTLCFGIPMIHMILEWKEASSHEQTDESRNPDDAETRVESLYLPSDTSPARETSDEPRDEDSDEDEDCSADGGPGDENDEDEDCSAPDGGPDDSVSADGGPDDCVSAVEAGADDSVSADEPQKQPLLGLILTPTRELAVQVKHHIDAVARFTGIKTALVVGGMAMQKQQRMLMRRPEIIIATPGRLWELIKERHAHLQDLRQLRCLVIDEADRMVEKGHFSELESLLEMLNTSQFSPRRQTFVFSATLTLVHSLPLRLTQKKKKRAEQRSKLQILMERVGMRAKPKVIDLTRKEATVETLTESRISCTKEDKDLFLYYFLLQFPGRSMVFANSIDCIKRLTALLQILDLAPLCLHANMHQKQRLKNLERFAEKDSCVLLTTDVSARGLDIPNVQHVIHYQVPRTSETYVHRSGRTARAAREGLSLLLIGPDDLMNYRKICRTLDKSEDLPVFPVQSKCMAAIKERVTLARRIEKMEFFHSRETQHNSWVRQAAEAMDIDVDDDLLMGGGKDEEDDREQQRLMKSLKNQLKQLISQPVFRHQMKTRYPTQMGKLTLPQLPLATADTALASVSRDRSTATLQR